MDEIIVRIGKLIREKRLEKGYTVQKLADMLDVSIGLISNIENAKTDAFNLELLIKLCNILDISLFSFFSQNISETKLLLDSNNTPKEIKQLYDRITNAFIETAIKVNYDEKKLKLLTDKIVSEINFFNNLIE
jgi:transcriptional regulator with XRE-family HTH domain